MDNSPIKVTKVIVPEEIQVNLADLPNIISDKIQLMDKLDKKVQNAQKAAKVAEEKAKELKGFKEKKFLWMISKCNMILTLSGKNTVSTAINIFLSVKNLFN